MLDGEYTSWHKNGQYKCRGFYKNGSLEGKNTCWYKNGTKESEENRINGDFKGMRKWSADGNEIVPIEDSNT